MKKLVIMFVLTLTFFSCQSQSKQSDKKNNVEFLKDSIEPKTNVKVHKEYDENGNLIRLDSTYVSFYSNIKGDSILENKVFKNFKRNFNEQLNLNNPFFGNDVFRDSLFIKNDFYTDDFFKNNFKTHQKKIDEMLKRMDSIKNSFYKKQKMN